MNYNVGDRFYLVNKYDKDYRDFFIIKNINSYNVFIEYEKEIEVQSFLIPTFEKMLRVEAFLPDIKYIRERKINSIIS